MNKKRIIITGASGLVGQNLITRLKTRGEFELIGIDKHARNNAIFRKLHPEVTLIEADLAKPGPWAEHFAGADAVVLNHAQIGALTEEPFVANNLDATEHVLNAIQAHSVGYIIHISSSVVNSLADDFYTRTKTKQEEMVLARGVPTVVLRPTLMHGWFDRKHLGWLSRFMKRSPVFPVPGSGEYVRQPLYAGDFCNIIISCIDAPKPGEIFNISGQEKVYYIDMIKALKEASGGKAIVMKIPYTLFWWLLKVYGLIDKDPPFTTQQLEALIIPEEFEIIDWPDIFGVTATPLKEAFRETYSHPDYAEIVLEF